MKPMLKYRGGKSRELSEIMPFIPQYSGRYIEPFVGGGALFFSKQPKQAIINDINKPLMSFYSGIQSDFTLVSEQLAELQLLYSQQRLDFEQRKQQSNGERVHDDNEALYYKIRSIFNGERSSSLHPATVYYFINKTAYSGMVRYNKEGKFNVPYGRYKHFNTELITPDHHELLTRTEIFSQDYSEIFNKSNSSDFIFLDPPYDCIFSDYGNKETQDGFTEQMHIRLAQDFKQLDAKALMVISKTPLIDSLYGDMIVHEYGKSYAVNIRNRFKSEARHVLVTNYTV